MTKVKYFQAAFMLILSLIQISLEDLPTEFSHYVNQDKNKLWFQYISKYLEQNIYQTPGNLLKKTQLWTQLVKYPQNYVSVITHPLGQLSKSIKTTETLKFNLDYRLRLNLTFQYIHIGYNGLHGCFLANITVKSFKTLFQYCGIQSNIIIYAKGINCYIFLRTPKEEGMMILFKIHMLFSTINSKDFVTLPVNHTSAGTPLWSLCLRGKYETLIMRFVFSSQKHQTILLQSSLSLPHFVVVFDGPGTLSPKTVLTSSLGFYTTTFQCIVDIWLQNKNNSSLYLNKLHIWLRKKKRMRVFM